MTDMVATLEGRSDVFRYAWFTGRVSPDPHYSSLLGVSGQLTSLGKLYLFPAALTRSGQTARRLDAAGGEAGQRGHAAHLLRDTALRRAHAR